MGIRPALRGDFGMVSSTHRLASEAAFAVLEDDGNAFDAAVAAAFVLHVVEPHLNGPAGEVPILLAPAGGPVRVLCGQGIAPAGASIAHYTGLGLELVPGTGPLAAAVPGAFDAWMLLLRDHGSKSPATVLDHAIGLAEHGHLPLPGVAQTVTRMRELFETEWTTSAEVYLPHGMTPSPRRPLRNQALAHTWRRVLAEAAAAGGDREAQIDAARRCWREGFVALDIAEFAARPTMDTSGERHAGTLTGADLANWSAAYEEPIRRRWRDWEVCKPGGWSQGPVMLQQLALLADEPAYGSAEYVHTLIEGGKLAMADREAWYGDAAEVPLDDLLSADYSADRRALIGREASYVLRPGRPGGRTPILGRHAREAADRAAGHRDRQPSRVHHPGTGEPTVAPTGATRGDTCHLDVVDRWGNLVSATPSGGWLQSNPVIPTLGFPLGTRLQMTWLEPGLPNSLTPGRRPRTTLSPSLALRGGVPVLAFGTPGGDRQDQWQTHFLLALTLSGRTAGTLDVQGAIDEPNWHQDSFPSSFYPREMLPGGVTAEAGLGPAVLDDLRRRGHDLTVVEPGSVSRLCAVARDPETGALTAGVHRSGGQGHATGR
ncbi:gamma-glutamyltransferase family protein [Embleya sp. NPDC050154]|uniref:gamma-glutamyltransferase family protein n=1 Tax=Embleya sp. NPDC050154 TaxID=3363988 RepID=UPI0037A44EFC